MVVNTHEMKEQHHIVNFGGDFSGERAKLGRPGFWQARPDQQRTQVCNGLLIRPNNKECTVCFVWKKKIDSLHSH
jgi:hypothetical protein